MGYIKAAGVAADVPASVPLIGYDNVVTPTNVTASSSAAGFPAANLANSATHLKWMSNDNTGGDITIATGLDTTINYLAIAKHNLGSSGALVELQMADPAQILLHLNSAGSPDVLSAVNTLGSPQTWTFNGNAFIDTTDFKFGNGSLKLDGASDWISTPDSPDFTLGASDFTIDFWFKCNAPTGVQRQIAGQASSATNTSFLFYRETDNKIYFDWSDGTNFVSPLSSTSTFTNLINTGWHHCAVVRAGTSMRLYIDGVLEASTTFSGTIPDCTVPMQVGSVNSQASSWLGWLDEFRMVVGLARWTAAFTPPTSPSGLAVLVNATTGDSQILLHLDVVGTTVIDSNALGEHHSWTVAGNAQISASSSKFGGAALLLDGAGDYIFTPASPDFNLSNENFTIDTWFNCTCLTGVFKWMMGQRGAINEDTSWFTFHDSATNRITWQWFTGGASGALSSTTTFTNLINPGWHHIALVRNGNTFTMYIDGISEASTSYSGGINNSINGPMSLGLIDAVNSWQGSFDEFRFTKGTARWTSNFTPPTAPATSGTTLSTSDDPILFRWTAVPVASLLLSIRAAASAPQIAVIYAGELLVLERSITIGRGHVPITYGRRTNMINGMSETGNFLGRIVLGEYRESKAEFEWFTPTFYRSKIDAFLDFAQEAPFFWVWNPEEYPAEVGYVWLTNNAEPETDPVTRRVALTLDMRGIA